MDELSEEDTLTVYRARKVQRFLSQPFQVAEVFTGTPGAFVKLEESVKGFRDIIAGKYDHLPESAFYMVGNITDVVNKAEKIATELAKAKDKEKLEKQDTTTTAASATKTEITSEEIAKIVKAAADEAKKFELDRATAIKAADKGDGQFLPGWSFPKLEDIVLKWEAWDKLFTSQSADIDQLIISHMEEYVARRAKEEAAEEAEL